MYYRILFIAITAILWPSRSSASLTDSESTSIKENLKNELRVVVNPRDSIRVLYDLFDLSTQAERPAFGWELYKVANRFGNDRVTMDILRQLTNCYLSDDSMLAVIENKMCLIPESPEQKESLLFVRMQQIGLQARNDTDAQQLESVRRLLAGSHTTGDTDKEDIYDRILQCYRICSYLGYSTKSSLASDYFNKLNQLIDQLPHNLTAIRSFYYTQAALIYTHLEFHDKAITADRKLLDIISQFEKEYSSQGRVYRNYAKQRYICYRRMLSNYPALTKDEVRQYYDMAKELRIFNKDIQNDFDTQQRPTMYYLLANQRYHEALPLIKKQLKYKNHRHNRQRILKDICTAAEACADSATWIKALSEYTGYLEDANRSSSAEAYRELQIRYDISMLEADNNQLRLEQLDYQIKTERLILGITLTCIALLLVLIIILTKKYRSSRAQRTDKTHFNGES